MANLDWTAIILALIAAWSATYAAWVSRQNSKAIRENNRMLKTNSGKTIGEHVESLQGTLAQVAGEKANADADLASAALAAVAKLATKPPPLPQQAQELVREVLDKAAEISAVLELQKEET